MSAAYGVVYPDRVEILTDGAVYADDGTVVGFAEKVWRSSRLPIALTSRGPHGIYEMLGPVIELGGLGKTVDGAIYYFAERLETLAGKEGVAPADCLIGAISETHGPVLYYFHTYRGDDPAGHAGYDPFKIYVVQELCLASHPDQKSVRDSGLPMYWALEGTAEHGVTFFNLLRRHKITHLAHPDKPELFGIGGHVDLTTVRADGATTERIHTWPEDVVGEKVRPAA